MLLETSHLAVLKNSLQLLRASRFTRAPRSALGDTVNFSSLVSYLSRKGAEHTTCNFCFTLSSYANMAAGSLTNTAFETHFDSKRKRTYDNDDITNGSDLFVAKRRNLTNLPIRSPPRPLIAVTPVFAQYGVPPGTLTPDSIPEDDGIEGNGRASTRPNTPRPHSDSTSSIGSLVVNVNTYEDPINDAMDMDCSSPKRQQCSTPVRIGRARSNDLLSPVRSPGFCSSLSPRAMGFGQDRLPTPVAQSFSAAGRSPFEPSFASASARQMRSQTQVTTLSPMIEAESWTPQIQRPPSPGPELDSAFDEDATMVGTEDSHMISSSFGTLSMHSYQEQDSPDMNSSPSRSPYSPRTRGSGLDGTSGSGGGTAMRPDNLRMSMVERDTETQSKDMMTQAQQNLTHNSGRTARLHMGYRADCEKCVARLPGHYSHILWT